MTIMAELWQFMSRRNMTRDNMSQALGAWGLGLGAFFHYS
jgi:hypothetical protein